MYNFLNIRKKMKKNIIIISIILSILIITAIKNPHSIAQLPWDSKLSFLKNITPYMVVLIVTAICYSTLSTLFAATGSLEDTSKNTETSIGRILNIEYSSLRINNSPRFKLTVEYNGIINTFDYLDESVQFHFKIGDEIIIKYNPKDINQANIDLNASILNKNSPKTSNAKFKVIEIIPNFSIKENIYEIIGEIHQANKEPRKAKLEEELSDIQLERFIPGAILSCFLEGEDDDLRVTFI